MVILRFSGVSCTTPGLLFCLQFIVALGISTLVCQLPGPFALGSASVGDPFTCHCLYRWTLAPLVTVEAGAAGSVSEVTILGVSQKEQLETEPLCAVLAL